MGGGQYALAIIFKVYNFVHFTSLSPRAACEVARATSSYSNDNAGAAFTPKARFSWRCDRYFGEIILCPVAASFILQSLARVLLKTRSGTGKVLKLVSGFGRSSSAG
ncbi:MAG TPA: hypothetical protein DCP12_02190 [Rhodobiaceae bacterium]|nr:hypothetical protein [Rhodobiaceae bacterium]